MPPGPRPAPGCKQLRVRCRFLLLVGALQALAVEIFRDEVPVDDVVEHRLQKLGPLIAIVDVLGMFPHIKRQQRHEVVDRGGVGVVERGDLEL